MNLNIVNDKNSVFWQILVISKLIHCTFHFTDCSNQGFNHTNKYDNFHEANIKTNLFFHGNGTEKDAMEMYSDVFYRKNFPLVWHEMTYKIILTDEAKCCSFTKIQKKKKSQINLLKRTIPLEKFYKEYINKSQSIQSLLTFTDSIKKQ